jgi:hypothetical protein
VSKEFFDMVRTGDDDTIKSILRVYYDMGFEEAIGKARHALVKGVGLTANQQKWMLRDQQPEASK